VAQFFIDRPIFAWVVGLIIMLAGALSILSLPVSARFGSSMQTASKTSFAALGRTAISPFKAGVSITAD